MGREKFCRRRLDRGLINRSQWRLAKILQEFFDGTCLTTSFQIIDRCTQERRFIGNGKFVLLDLTLPFFEDLFGDRSLNSFRASVHILAEVRSADAPVWRLAFARRNEFERHDGKAS